MAFYWEIHLSSSKKIDWPAVSSPPPPPSCCAFNLSLFLYSVKGALPLSSSGNATLNCVKRALLVILAAFAVRSLWHQPRCVSIFKILSQHTLADTLPASRNPKPIARGVTGARVFRGFPFFCRCISTTGQAFCGRIERSFIRVRNLVSQNHFSRIWILVDRLMKLLLKLFLYNFACVRMCVCVCVSWCTCTCMHVWASVCVPAWLRAYSWSNEHMDDGIDRNLRRTWSWLSGLKYVSYSCTPLNRDGKQLIHCHSWPGDYSAHFVRHKSIFWMKNEKKKGILKHSRGLNKNPE